MRKLRELVQRFDGLFNKQRKDRELDEEIESHLQLHIEDNLRSGMTPEEARRQALIKLGGIESAKEAYRDQRGLPLLEILWQDVRIGARMLRRNVGFATAAVLTLGLGIGANTAIFSVVNAVLLRPLPYSDAERLVQLWENNKPGKNPLSSVAPANFLDWKAQSTVFERMAAADFFPSFNLATTDGPERVQGARVSADFFPLFGVRPALGRVFGPEEEQRGKDAVVLVSHDLWQNRLGSDPGIIGQTLLLNEKNFVVVGVLPRDFHLPRNEFDLAIPLAFENWEAAARGTRPLHVYGKVKNRITLAQAQAELTTIGAGLEQAYPSTNSEKGVTVLPLHEQVSGRIRTALLVLLGAVGFVLLIACANIANLLMVRFLARQTEFAVRHALGAGRWRLVTQTMTESLLLALFGALAAVPLAIWSKRLLTGLLNGAGLVPGWLEVPTDAPVLVFTLGAALVTGLLFGLVPAIAVMTQPLKEGIEKAGRKLTMDKEHRRVVHSIVVSEIALALVLLVCAGLMFRSFYRLLGVDPGFRAENILAVSISLPNSRYPKAPQAAEFYQRLLDRLAVLPGVESAGATAYLPLSGARNAWSFDIEGAPPLPPDRVEAEWRAVTPRYFKTMGTEIIRGRDFAERDIEGQLPVMMINQAMANLYWPGADPIGRRIKLHDARRQVWAAVVGIVEDVRHFGPAIAPKPEMYFPVSQLIYPWLPMTFVLRTDGEPKSLGRAVRQTVLEMDKQLPVYNIRTMEEMLSEIVAPNRLHLAAFGVFAALALGLASIGLYGILAFSVAQRTREIGIRMALGASRRSLVVLVLRQGIKLATLGIGLGVAIGLATTRVVEKLVFEIPPTDPATFIAVSSLLFAVAVVASLSPARRATRLRPIDALRYE